MSNKVDAILSILHTYSKAHPDLQFTEILIKFEIIGNLSDSEVLEKMRVKLLTMTSYNDPAIPPQ